MLLQTCLATRRLTALVQEQPITMEYQHKGALLSGCIAVNLVWYGNFSAPQRAVLSDFVSSLASASASPSPQPQPEPSVATFFKTARKYYATSKARFSTLAMGGHVLDQSCSLSRRLREKDLVRLAARHQHGAHRRDVAVNGAPASQRGRTTSSKYEPQTAPLAPANGDVGVDGMVVSLSSMIIGNVTNPFGNGFFQGPAEVPLEAAMGWTAVKRSNAATVAAYLLVS
ncbi:hypothetical protein ACQ4PT_028771 [Festuca glaucescens]